MFGVSSAGTVLSVPYSLPAASRLPWLVHMAARKNVGSMEMEHCDFCYTLLAKASHQGQSRFYEGKYSASTSLVRGAVKSHGKWYRYRKVK